MTEEEPVEPDAVPAGAGASASARERPLRRVLRRAGLTFQVLLCTALTGWALVTGVAVFAGLAVVLLAVATWLLIRELRGCPNVQAGLPPGADLGEGAADDHTDEPEGGE